MPRDLFNAAFVSCWTELSQQHQNELVKSLEQALRVPDLPEITQTILNLAEFMEHCEKGPLPLDPQLLGQRAIQCRAYAKALHYKEAEFHESPTSQVISSTAKESYLISFFFPRKSFPLKILPPQKNPFPKKSLLKKNPSLENLSQMNPSPMNPSPMNSSPKNPSSKESFPKKSFPVSFENSFQNPCHAFAIEERSS